MNLRPDTEKGKHFMLCSGDKPEAKKSSVVYTFWAHLWAASIEEATQKAAVYFKHREQNMSQEVFIFQDFDTGNVQIFSSPEKAKAYAQSLDLPELDVENGGSPWEEDENGDFFIDPYLEISRRTIDEPANILGVEPVAVNGNAEVEEEEEEEEEPTPV